jgi:tetratricopeptide (TPR) repeat protein/DNA-binding SARP family transcriptional activator
VGARFRILGHTGLLIGNEFDDQWGQPKVRGVLAALLLHPGRAVTRDQLIEWVWPDGKSPQQQALYTYVSRARDALGRMAAPPELVPARGAYRIDVDKADIDYYEFRRLVEHARQCGQQGDHTEARDCLVTAVDLWTERPLADLEGERASFWRRQAETESLIPAHADLMRELMALGEFDEVLRRLADLPMEYRRYLILIKRTLEALFELHRGRDATTYFLAIRKQMLADADQAEADELTRFHDELLLRRQRRSKPLQIQANSPDASTAAARPVPHHLPHDISDFAGRADLLQRLDQIATTPDGTPPATIVVLEGPPGVGKTSLAVHWSHQASRRFPDGQLYLDLHGFSDETKVEPAAAIERLLIQLGAPATQPTATAGLVSRLRNLVAGRHMLILLDNAASTEHIQLLLDSLPCTVLITSRRRLTGLSRRGAVAVPVLLLNHDDSRAWLAQRLGDRANREAAALSDLTGICGGNMLALRLVGEHIGSRPQVRLAEFVDELVDGQALLDLGDDPDSPRGSLRATFDLSYQALDPDEQRVLCLLGLHPGPDVSLDAVASLTAQDLPWVKRRLDALVSAHLLGQPEQRARYRFHDLVRRYAADCSSQERWHDERDAAERRLLSYYHHGALNADLAIFPNRIAVPAQPVVDGVRPPEFHSDKTAVDWLVRERANLGAIIQLASRRGFHTYVTTTANATGETYQRLGYHAAVLSALRAGLLAAESGGDLLGQAYSLSNLGFVHAKRRDFAMAESCYHRAKVLFDQVEFRLGSATSVHHLAKLHIERGDYRAGVDAHRAALSIFRAIDSPGARGLEVIALYRLAEGYRCCRDFDAAMTCARDALWLAERQLDHEGQASCLGELAAIYYDLGDLVTAKVYCNRSIVLYQQLPDSGLSGRNWRLLGLIHRDEKDLEQAESSFRTSVTHFHEARDVMGEATAYDLLGQVLHRKAAHDSAVEAWSKALALFAETNGAGQQADAIRLRLSELATGLSNDTPEQTRPLNQDSIARSPGRTHTPELNPGLKGPRF